MSFNLKVCYDIIMSHYDWKVLLQIIGINYFIFAEGVLISLVGGIHSNHWWIICDNPTTLSCLNPGSWFSTSCVRIDPSKNRSVLWCPLRFRMKTVFGSSLPRLIMFGSSLPTVVCRRDPVLYTLFVFACAKILLNNPLEVVWSYKSKR
jgi:hypothetical protein